MKHAFFFILFVYFFILSFKPLLETNLPTLNKLVGNFSLLLKPNGIKIFLINDKNVIIRKLELSMTWKCFKKKNRIQFSNELLVVLKVIASCNKSKSIMTYLNSNKNE